MDAERSPQTLPRPAPRLRFWALQLGVPAGFLLCLARLAWDTPHLLVSLGWASEGLARNTAAAGALDWGALVLGLILLGVGCATMRISGMEDPIRSPIDRLGVFLGRVCMLLIVVMVAVMFFEVVMRYLFENPTLWANELTLWCAGFVFAVSGVYTMQQRGHIAITLVHDVVPIWLRRVFDTVSTLLIVAFAGTLIWGAFTEAHDKFLRWETFGTAFNPPIPATLKPLILLVVALIALQAVVNLIRDWGRIDVADTDDAVLRQTLRTAGHDVPGREG